MYQSAISGMLRNMSLLNTVLSSLSVLMSCPYRSEERRDMTSANMTSLTLLNTSQTVRMFSVPVLLVCEFLKYFLSNFVIVLSSLSVLSH